MRVAIIGGTGVDEMAGLMSGGAERVTTRFGETELFTAKLAERSIVFLPRHGRGHSVAPSRINYRAQMAALKSVGVTRVIAVCAVGSLRRDAEPGEFAVLGDFIDLTRQRQSTFFDDPGGPVVHTDFSTPYCPEVSAVIEEAIKAEHIRHRARSVYIGVDGPRYESPAEIKLFGSWGGDVIGMTGLPEVVLAREAGICYGSVAVITNVAAAEDTAPVSHDEVRGAMKSSGAALMTVLSRAVALLPSSGECACGSNTALDVA